MRVYLDHNATSPLRPETRAAMTAALDLAANASSVHREGQRARGVIEEAREEVARAIGASPESLVFTGGGTEACNLALLGAVRGLGIGRVIVSAIEHGAVLEPARAAGVPVDVAPVTTDGILDPGALEAMLEDGGDVPTLVAVMAANNETGAIQPVSEVAGIAHAHGAFVFCDAIQVLGKMAFDVTDVEIDLAALSAHKVGGPQGAGALYARPGLALQPLVRGGGQERGLRGGTENVAAISGFAAAVSAAGKALENEAGRLGALRDRLEELIVAATPDALILAAKAPRLANTTAVALPGASPETLVIALDLEGIAVSAGAACSSGKVGASHVVEAMGFGREIGGAALRVSAGWSTAEADIDAFAAAWAKAVPAVRELAAA